MPTLALDNILEITHFCRLGTQLGENVRHFGVTAVGGLSLDVSDIPNLWFANVQAQYSDAISADAQFVGIAVRRIIPTKTLYYFSTTAPVTGGGTGGVLPLAVSGVITLRSDTPGQSARGRAYIPFPAEDDSDDGHPNANYVTNLGAVAGKFLGFTVLTSGGNSVTLQSGVWSRKLSFFFPITVVVPKNKWATQHPRGDYGQENPAPFQP